MSCKSWCLSAKWGTVFLMGNRAEYFLDFRSSASDGKVGSNGVAMIIIRANIGFCPDAMDLVRVPLTVWTNCLDRPFYNEYFGDNREWVKHHCLIKFLNIVPTNWGWQSLMSVSGTPYSKKICLRCFMTAVAVKMHNALRTGNWI